MKAAYEGIISPKSFVHRRWGKSCLVRQREERDSNDVYAVKTYATKAVQNKCNNDFPSFQLHFIINFVVTEPKLAHGPDNFPARLISHFVMNIIMAK